MTARYDNGFGFSQLYRFVDDKESKETKSCCDLVLNTNKSKLLPLNVSNRWKVIVTPKVKGDGHAQKQLCQSIMEDILNLSQENEIGPTKILMTQYRKMFSYREEQINGVFEAINILRQASFGNLEFIHFEVDIRYRDRFYKQLRAALIST